MRTSGSVRRLRSAEECVVIHRLNATAAVVAGVCLVISMVILGLAWRVLAG
jgi:hypothetical protein